MASSCISAGAWRNILNGQSLRRLDIHCAPEQYKYAGLPAYSPPSSTSLSTSTSPPQVSIGITMGKLSSNHSATTSSSPVHHLSLIATRAPWPIFATTVDGIRVHMQSQQVQMAPDRVDQLTADPLRSSGTPYMRELLRTANLPALTTLVVHYEEDAVDPSGAPARREFPVFNLPSDSQSRFPSLSSIKMINGWMRWSPALASQVRVLELGTSVEEVFLGLPVDSWLECLGNFSRIEELSLTRCFAPHVGPPGGVTASARRPLDASRLRLLEIEDHPVAIGIIMSALIVPTSATVHLCGIVREASPEQCGGAILVMLPRDKSRLPILHSCKGVEVAVQDKECQIIAYAQEGHSSESESGARYPDQPSPRLLLTLHTNLCNPAFDTAQETRLSLFTVILSMFKYMFSDAKDVTLLKVCGPTGDYDTIDQRCWADALIPFPGLRHLIADDEHFTSFPGTLVDALMMFYAALPHPAAPVICLELDTLALYGDIEDEVEGAALLDRIIACLEWRRERGGPTTLQSLKIGLYSPAAISEEFLAHYRRKFYRLAMNCSLKVDVTDHPIYDRSR